MSALERRTKADRRKHHRSYERRVTGGLPVHTVEIAAGLLAASSAFFLFVLAVY